MSALRGGASARLLCGALLLATGCGAGVAPAFDLRFPDNDDVQLQQVREQLAQAPAAEPAAAPLLVATTHGAQPELLAYDLEHKGVRWRKPFRADSRPELLGDLVCSASGEQLFGFDARSGGQRFAAALRGCTYLGAARDAERLFFVCQHAGSSGTDQSARLTALDARSGRLLWQRTASGLLGRPAARAGLVFVPWQRQNLAVLDARDGDELARIRLSDDVVEWVIASGSGVFFGQRSVHHLGGARASLERTGQPLIATDVLPGRPPLHASGFEPQPGSRSARGRVALQIEPALEAGAVRVARDRYYLVFYRYVFGFDGSGALRWAHMLPHDLIAAQAAASGLLTVSERGQVLLLPSDDGQPLVVAELGMPLAAARLGAPQLSLPQPRPQPPPLRRMLSEIALDTDNRLVPARGYAVARLAELQEPEVTRDLLDIYAQTTSAPELERVVADALRARRTGLEHLIDALLQRYDFIEQTRPAPLAVIVPALVEAREARAVPNLVQRMFDHETPLPVLPAVVSAVATLGAQSASESLLAFLRQYRADSSFAEQPQALLDAAAGVLAHGGDQAPALLAAVTADGRANPALASGIAALLAPSRPGAAPAQAVAAAAAPEPAPPERLAQEAINAAFAEHVDDLRQCVIDEVGRNPKLAQVRVAFVAESDGSAHAFSFVPNTPQFVDCLYPKVAGYRFPRFRAGREVAKYVVSVRTQQPAPAEPVAQGAPAPWWQWFAARPRAQPATSTEPWWRSRQPIAPLAVNPRPAGGPPPSITSPAPTVEAAQPPPPPAPAATPGAPAPSAPTAPPTPEPAPEDAWWMPQSAPR